MELTERAEEILESLWIDIVEREKMPDIFVLKDDTAFKELQSRKYISLDTKELLTSKGKDEGKLCVRRHRLAERLLTDVLHVKSGLVHETGCRLEHALHKGIEDNICILLGHPRACPHGRPIPEGRCCIKKQDKAESLVKPLSGLKKGERGKIAYLHTGDKDMLRKIMAMGALPGLSVALVQGFPSYVFQIGESQFAVDESVAKQIHVWVSK